MKILGGTGFLGSRLIPKLAQAGHRVFAMTRSLASHDALRASGAVPVDADLESTTPLSKWAVVLSSSRIVNNRHSAHSSHR
jgi:uncharacterized protein YbjT (DUF2867 family)